MVNDSKTCQEPGCQGRMVKVGERQACEPGTPPAATGFTVDLYECLECGAEDWS